MSVVSTSLKNTSTRHGNAILRRLPYTPVRGVEVGVCRGVLSAHLLIHRPELHLTMVDWWRAYAPDSDDYRWSVDHHEPCGQQTPEQVEDNYRAARKIGSLYPDRTRVIRGESSVTAELFGDASCDFVFIDADHRYEAVVRDIAVWLPKVRPGGWIGGHDYATPGFDDGVVRAVDEFADRTGLPIELDEFFTWFARIGGDRDA